MSLCAVPGSRLSDCDFVSHRVPINWCQKLLKVSGQWAVSQDSNMGSLTLTVSTESKQLAPGQYLETWLSSGVHRQTQLWMEVYLFVWISPLLGVVSTGTAWRENDNLKLDPWLSVKMFLEINYQESEWNQFFNFIFSNFIGVQLIFNVVLASGVQHGESVIHTRISILFQSLFPYSLLQNIE